MISSNPFSQVSSSTNVFSPPISVFDYEKEDVHFNYHQLPIDNPFYISTDFVCPVSPPPVTNDVTTLKQDFILQQQYFEDHNDLLDSVISSYKKKTVNSKTDGRSKIYTAGGHRDRRVRLSIDIARKLICLQDLLGFDKASKTLGWLLTKSLTAIKDLVEQTNNCLSSTLTDESKAAKLLETIIGDLDEQNCQKKKPLLKCVDGKGKKNMTQRSKSGSQMIFSREQSRAEARTRARERTKQKSRAKKLNDCCQIELQKGYKDMMSWECVMDQETSKKSKDSSFQNRAFHEQLLGNHAVNDSNLEYGYLEME